MSAQSAAKPLFIDTAASLNAFCQSIAGCTWLAMDTEFLRDKSYYPQFCLLQIAADGHVACIDPQALPDLGPLLDILYDPKVTKVLHAARQDMEIFHQRYGRLPAPVFDTQIAAPLLAMPTRSVTPVWCRSCWASSWKKAIPARIGRSGR